MLQTHHRRSSCVTGLQHFGHQLQPWYDTPETTFFRHLCNRLITVGLQPRLAYSFVDTPVKPLRRHSGTDRNLGNE
jgi:hypothetical protein